MESRLKNLSVLIVEDEISSLELMSDIISCDVKEVYKAKDALEGLEIYEKYEPDIVVSDIEMGEMNGLEMTRVLKEIKSTLPVVIITAYDHNDYIECAKRYGVKFFIKKPISYSKLIEALESSALEVV